MRQRRYCTLLLPGYRHCEKSALAAIPIRLKPGDVIVTICVLKLIMPMYDGASLSSVRFT
jgi:hypothetical protein